MSGFDVYNNTFNNCQVGTFIGGGRRNHVHNNQYYNCTIAVHEDNRGMTWRKDDCSPVRFNINCVVCFIITKAYEVALKYPYKTIMYICRHCSNCANCLIKSFDYNLREQLTP